MPPKKTEEQPLTLEQQFAAFKAEQEAKQAQHDAAQAKLLQAVEQLQKENKALKAANGTTATAEALAKPEPTYVRAKVSSITLKGEEKTVKITIAARYVETGYITVRMKHRATDTDDTPHTVKIDDALAKNVATDEHTEFSKKCLSYILQHPKSVQWTVEDLSKK